MADSSLGMTAQQACQTISTKAEEIAAQGDALTGIMKNLPLYSAVNPNNYLEATNSATEKIKNITNLDMSNHDTITIRNTCNNTISQIGSNVIENTCTPDMVIAYTALLNSPYCTKYPDKCPPLGTHNVTQMNSNSATATCVMSQLMDIAKKQTASIDTSAVIEANQKAINRASNKSSTDTCNFVNQDMSSHQYIEAVNSCAANIDQSGSNKVSSCLPAYEISQNNNNNAFASCVAQTTGTVTTEQSSTIVQKVIAKITQYAEGLNPAASSASSFACLLICALCLFLCMGMGGGGGGGGGDGEGKAAAVNGIVQQLPSLAKMSGMSGMSAMM